MLFGIHLNDSSRALLSQIENLYGSKVQEKENEEWPPDFLGQASIDEDGKPVVEINAATGRTEENIVHELFHLKLLLEGYPQESSVNGPKQFMLKYEDLFRQVGGLVLAPITHLIFYPQMRTMGLDPGTEITADIKRKLLGTSYGDLKKTTAVFRSTYYMIAALECGDSKVLDELSSVYRKHGWTRELEQGERLANLITRSKASQPDEVIDVFVACLDILFQGEARFQFSNWKDSTRGPHTIRDAVFKVTLN